ncbi:MAG: RNA-binding protein [Chloroflexi bacterium RBG_16_69_14]|nr:MAG: RNA-binding protein [Chloroflexi bacterium RBG_16_69_14]
MPLRDDLASLDAWGFAFPGPLRDELTALALAGVKTTTAGLFAEMEADGEALPAPGVREILLDTDQRPVAVIETVGCRVVRLADVDDRHAIDEGEGYANAAAFRASHERFWNGYIDDLRRRLGADFAIDDDTLVVLQRFRVVERLEPD